MNIKKNHKKEQIYSHEKMNRFLEKQREDSIKRIEKLAKFIDARRLFIAICAQLCSGPVDYLNHSINEATTAKTELLAFYLYPFFNVSNNKNISPIHTNECLDALDKLLISRSLISSVQKHDNENIGAINKLIDSTCRYAETVRGSAFPEQTRDEIIEVQGKYEKWFSRKIGIGPIRAQEILWAIIRAEENSLSRSMKDIYKYADIMENRWKDAKSKVSENKTAKDHYLLRIINETRSPEFKEFSTGRRLIINKNNLKRIYLLTVSQHHLAGLATRLAIFRPLGLFKDNEFPFSISVADLDVISEFCEGSDVFLHYIEKRLEAQKRSEMIIGDELDFFSAYLTTRLQASKLWEREGKKFNFVGLSGFSNEFSKWMMFKRGEIKEKPDIKLDVPVEVYEILNELRKRKDNIARWIAFALLDMSDDNLLAIAQAFREIRSAKLTSGMFRRLVYQSGKLVISFVASIDLPESLLHERTKLRVLLEKYRRKAFISMGFGINLMDNSRPFELIVWAEGPWDYDQEMEKLIESEPTSFPVPGSKLPKRNEPCICGSGKKFKKCCLHKIEEYYKR